MAWCIYVTFPMFLASSCCIIYIGTDISYKLTPLILFFFFDERQTGRVRVNIQSWRRCCNCMQATSPPRNIYESPPPITHNQLRQSLPFTGQPSSTVGQQMVKIANYNSDRYSKRLPFNHEFGSVTIWRHALTPQSNPRPMVSRGTWGPLEHLDWVPIPFFPFLHPISFLSPFSSASQS